MQEYLHLKSSMAIQMQDILTFDSAINLFTISVLFSLTISAEKLLNIVPRYVPDAL